MLLLGHVRIIYIYIYIIIDEYTKFTLTPKGLCFAGEECTLYLQSMDKFENPISHGGISNSEIYMMTKGPTGSDAVSAAVHNIIDMNDGTYKALFIRTKAGFYFVYTYLHSDSIKDFPYSLEIRSQGIIAKFCSFKELNLVAYAGIIYIYIYIIILY